MRITRLAAAMTAAGVLVLAGATPVLAADLVPTVTPGTIQVEGGFTATLTGCDADEASIQTDLLEGPSEALDKAADGTFSKTFAGTDKNAEPGTHKVVFMCGDTPAGSVDITVTAPTPAPKFDADITPHVFTPGDRLTLTTTGCPTLPTVEDVDGLFTGKLVLKETGDNKTSGSAVTKTDLSPTKTYHVVVTCADVGTVTFSAVPGKKTTKHHGGQTGVVPVGGVQTGDGSSLNAGGGNAVLAGTLGVSAAVLAGALALAYRRRKAREDA
ncbi:MAG TPA: hypothetical protein VF069_00485 [Streptosporangiaceae bacterium]